MKKKIAAWAKARPIQATICATLGVHAVLATFEPPTNSLRFNDERMIGVAQRAAHAAFFGDVKEISGLMEGSLAPPDVGSCAVDPMSIGLVEAKSRMIKDLVWLQEGENPLARVHLASLEKVDDHFAVASFYISEQRYGTPLWIKPFPAIVTVTLKYSQQPSGSWVKNYARQIINASYLPDAVRKYASGDWGLLNEFHLYCASDYYKSIVEGKAGLDIEKPRPPSSGQLDEKSVQDLANNAFAYRDKLIKMVGEKTGPRLKQAVDDIRVLNGLSPLPPAADDPSSSLGAIAFPKVGP